MRPVGAGRLSEWNRFHMVRRQMPKLTPAKASRETVGMQIVPADTVLDVVVVAKRVAH
ncbi:hypothetical protein GCM10009849_07950 [Sinomonas flava]|uniref:Uncharacterized protein n=1 Tax=Sinomonas flava TaxID=496857 RepID=A0ABN3BLI7_9MICC